VLLTDYAWLVQAPELLEELMTEGAHLLLSCLDDVWSGAAASAAQPQDEVEVTTAPKVNALKIMFGGRALLLGCTGSSGMPA